MELHNAMNVKISDVKDDPCQLLCLFDVKCFLGCVKLNQNPALRDSLDTS